MNSIKQVTSGLSSSLFLAIGFTRLAEKTDPVLAQGGRAIVMVANSPSSDPCTFPCAFTPDRGI